jgi:endonuclease-8
MPEGDTIARAARTLQRALAGQTVTAFESAYPALTRVHDDHPIVGRTIDDVSARGKHLLIAFSGGLTLRTHMRMHGAWHLYRPGERWRRPAREMRLLVATAAFVAVGFNIPDAELLGASALARHRQLRALGPDLLDPAFDRDEALRRMRAQPGEPIADVLLNQRVMAGIGNVFKSEVLFVAGVHPFARTADLSDERLRRIVEVAQKQLTANVADRARTLAPAFGRRTTGSLHPSKALWVYGRAGDPCRRCGTPIALDLRRPDARLTYWCPRCQQASAARRQAP